MTSIDGCVHPRPASESELREFMAKPWSEYPFSKIGEHPLALEFSEQSSETTVASLRKEVLTKEGHDYAVLVPLTRGLMADSALNSELASGTNRWLASKYLTDAANADSRLFGSIRVNPNDVDAACREIDAWKDDPQMVQVVVSSQSHVPYGDRGYWKIWEKAADAGLPVAVLSDRSSGIEFNPSAAGPVRTSAEWYAARGLNFVYHLTSCVGSGVFEAIPGLKFVFLDGGYEAYDGVRWKLDLGWRTARAESPWVSHEPTRLLAKRVWFCWDELGYQSGGDYPGPMTESEWDGELFYGSHYPEPGMGSTNAPSLFSSLTEPLASQIRAKAGDLYSRIPAKTAATA